MNFALTALRTKNRVIGSLFPHRVAAQARQIFLHPRRHPAKTWEKDMEQQGTRIQLGAELSALSWGTVGPKVLLVHGWESRATQMSGFTSSLLKQGFQVIALDGPAHGLSKGKKANPYVFAKAVMQAADQLGPFDYVIGHSMGGNALATAMAEGLRPKRAVFISSPSSITNVLIRFSAFLGLPKRSQSKFIELVEQEVGKPAAELNTASNMARQTCEGLIIHDLDDAEIPFEEAQEILKLWPQAQLHQTQGLGHRKIVRDAEVWQKVASFLSAA